MAAVFCRAKSGFRMGSKLEAKRQNDFHENHKRMKHIRNFCIIAYIDGIDIVSDFT